MKPEGTLWLNLGDSYANNFGTCKPGKTAKASKDYHTANNRVPPGLKPKDLCGIPWRVAFALQADGWYLRQDIIWAKPNPMPESVTDRATKSHEYIFLLTKKPYYYYDSYAIREGEQVYTRKAGGYKNHKDQMIDGYSPFKGKGGFADCDITTVGRNKRSVWTVTTAPYKEAHFATFPPKLIEPCILAGCPEWVCKKCGKARVRITETEQIKRRRKTPVTQPCTDRSPSANAVASVISETVGWTDCGCGTGFAGGVCLDPFCGTNTVGMVAYENRRQYIGIELNENYIKMDRAEKAKEKYGLFNGGEAE